MRASVLGIALFVVVGSSIAAGGAAEERPPAEAHAPAPAPSPAPVTTHHAIQLNGTSLAYSATAGYLPLADEEGKPLAEIFFVAYTRDGGDSARRPIAFAFNGGPGASSVWLQLGGIGPKRVPLAADGTQLPVVDRLVDNEWTWLDFTDLVFIDPIGTGYSRAAPGVNASQFYAVDRDVEVAGEFIRRYVTQYGRWLSPKFVIGESYGTTRAASLASSLPRVDGLDLSGVVLLSSALNFQTFLSEDGNDLPYPLALPSFTAVAWYHHRLPVTSPPDPARVAQWALTEYSAALAQGDRLAEAERRRVLERLAQFTGLAESYLETNHLRVSAPQFAKELLRAQDRVVGVLDGRVVGVGLSPRGEYPEYDPSLLVVTGPYVAVINDYLRRDLGFETMLRYEYLSREVNGAWKYASAGRGYLYVADDLAEAMTKDPRLLVFAGAGRYDLTTPYLAQQYTFDHLDLDPSVRPRLTFRVYASGHQIYTDLSSLRALKADVAAFVRQAGTARPGRRQAPGRSDGAPSGG